MDAVSATSIAISKRAYGEEDNKWRAYYADEYPHQLWWLVSCFIAFVAVCQLTSFVVGKYQVRSKNAPLTTESNKIQLSRLPLALVNYWRVLSFRVHIGVGSYTLNLAEVFLTCAYIVALFTWEFINSTTVAGAKFSATYLAGRAGSLATSQFPLVTALGTKNNIVSLITGVSYDKLNYIHRMAARVCFIMLWIHGGYKFQRVEGKYELLWVRMALVAISAFSLLILVSLRPVRAGAYEFFFYAHFLMVLIFLIGGYYHSKNFEFDSYVWPSFIIWGLDRVIRMLRVVVFNHSYFGFKAGHGTFDASVERLSEHFVRLTLKRPPHFHWRPGQTAYLITPGVSRLPFEAHPFTIASYDSSYDSTEKSTDVEKGSDSVLAKSSSKSFTPGGEKYWKELVFLVNVREGFTHRLATIGTDKGTVKVFVDGPYGPSPDLSSFNTSVFVAGGTGVSYTLPLLLDTIERVRDGKSICTKAVFIWAIRDTTHVCWISNAISNALLRVPPSMNVDIRIYVTGGSPESVQWDTTSVDSDTASRNGPPSFLGLDSVNVYQGRPDISQLLPEQAEATRGGRMSVTVCGSRAVAQSCRSALQFPLRNAATVLRGGASVTLHVESFGYA
ncbi:ferric reductase NAD binding domain-containing protein [Desarmillaria tabescens]|uniref:ferric-chelate reductase (NADPH) n=1 Tax=Armillaria tabescens TaxID=1929756 RepID=A0AA39MRJ6_ARMTA|nr:ferric reductase NAD binding domain-containing protein [Desarmillaria tabescens]KAK0443404.1 ferric reductase NAD binding domain-containing protein [Desarmillaria tabescens]